MLSAEQRMPAGAGDRWIRVPGGQLRLRTFGTGPETLLFVHGLLVSGEVWRGVAPRLAETHRCLVPDLPFGSHERPLDAGADLRAPAVADMLAALLDAAAAPRATLVASDTGTPVALEFAARHRHRVGRLVLTNGDVFEGAPLGLRLGVEAWARLPGAARLGALALRSTRVRRLPGTYGWLTRRPIPRDVHDRYLAPSDRDGGVRRDAVRFWRGGPVRHTEAAIAALRADPPPTLVVWGSADRWFPPHLGRRLAEALPGAELAVVDGARTLLPEDAPERLTALIADYLARTAVDA